MHTSEGHDGFAAAVSRVRDDLVAFLVEARRAGQEGRRIRCAGQGQHAAELLRDPARPARVHGGPQSLQARPVHPGHPDPVLPPERIAEDRPDYVLVLPWNLRDELVEQLAYVREWGGKLVFPIPALEVV